MRPHVVCQVYILESAGWASRVDGIGSEEVFVSLLGEAARHWAAMRPPLQQYWSTVGAICSRPDRANQFAAFCHGRYGFMDRTASCPSNWPAR